MLLHSLPSSLPLIVLINSVILNVVSTLAQQAVNQPSQLPPSTSQVLPLAPNALLEIQTTPQPVTKPSLVQLTRSTTSAQPEFISTTSLVPNLASTITIDVSQPTIASSTPIFAPYTSTISPVAVTLATTTTTTTTTTSRPHSRLVELPPIDHQNVPNFSIPFTPSSVSQLQAAPVSNGSNNTQSSNLVSEIYPPLTQSQPQHNARLNTGAVPEQSVRANSARAQEFRRLVDVPAEGRQSQPQSQPVPSPNPLATIAPTNTTATATATATTTTTAVQFLKAKSKLFKCRDSSECNGGMCNTSSGRCFCPPGFTGESCAINIDECRQTNEPCYNNGICIDEIDSFRCECAPGFKGDRCQESVDMCLGLPCLNGARCINHRVNYTCLCEPGWEGKTCDKNINECVNNPCQNNGTCYDEINDYRCDCGSSGFTGKNCDVDFDDCAIKPCGVAAKECIDLTGDFKCVCHDGFTGKRCEIDIEECQTNPCENNGTCIEKSFNVHHLHNLTAELPLFYHELRTEFNGNISNGQLNMSQYAGYTCECKEEFHGDRCEEKKKCYTKSTMELCGHKEAECLNVGNSYECLINASFDGTGSNYATYRINGEVMMREIFVKYRSFTGGIMMTFDIAPPESPPVDLILNSSGVYLGEMHIKREDHMNFDEPLLDGNEHSFRLATSPLEIRAITLARPSTLNDFHPTFKGCLMQLRVNGQLVPFTDYGFNMSNFELIDSHLEVGQCRTCFEKDCSNGGHCDFRGYVDQCICTSGYTGVFCDEDVNECQSNFNLCLNGGLCENTRGSYRCNCKEGFKGEKCQEISDYCKAKQPCTNLGICKNLNLAQLPPFQCDCPSAYIGKRCERKRDCKNECDNHHSQCINNVTCACLPGRREERIMCEHVSCAQVQGELCLNGGTCRDRETGEYTCVCQEPYFGPICQYVLEKPQFDVILLIVVACVGFLMAAGAVVFLIIFRSVRKARATRGTYSPSTQEKFGNAASDLLKPPQPERLI